MVTMASGPRYARAGQGVLRQGTGYGRCRAGYVGQGTLTALSLIMASGPRCAVRRVDMQSIGHTGGGGRARNARACTWGRHSGDCCGEFDDIWGVLYYPGSLGSWPGRGSFGSFCSGYFSRTSTGVRGFVGHPISWMKSK